MSNDNLVVRKAAVLGAGVMGAQIAAHLVNANIETLLFELPAKEGDPNANVNAAVDKLKKQEPAPLSVPSKATYIQPANYEQHLELLKDCDLVIEAIGVRMDWKSDLYAKVAPDLGIVALTLLTMSSNYEMHLLGPKASTASRLSVSIILEKSLILSAFLHYRQHNHCWFY